MSGQLRFFVFAVLALYFAAVANAATSIIVADFVEVNAKRQNAILGGTAYYLYDSATVANCRLRVEYKLRNGQTVSNLYHYGDEGMYSMCSAKCTGIRTSEKPDPWYYSSSVYTKGSAESGLYWFTRKSGTNTQVSKILMSESTSATNQIKKIEFTDGRVWTLSNVRLNPSGVTSSSAKFKTDSGLNCPRATCPMYADLIFVLDNSGSVDSSEWKAGGKFVNGVMQSFTFGIDAVEAAIIQFNAPSSKTACTRGTCSKCSNDYVFKDSAYPGSRTASVYAGKQYTTGGELLLSPEEENLEKAMNASHTPSGNTCQGFGLELAMHLLDNSPRANNPKKPKPIIIVVTDGADMCPNKTANAAEKLRKQYDAFVIEIGVGLSTGCSNYDRKFLERIASKIGDSTNPAYYPVDNYGAIKTLTEQLFKPLCDDWSSECGAECLGFCGCGQCFCPNCTSTGSTCLSNTCAERDGTSTGCVVKDIPCEIADDVCTQYKCRGDKTGSERCEALINPCTDMKNNNKETCRQVLCNPSVGGCYVNYRDNYCPSNECEKYKCARPEDKTTGAGVVYDSKTGCLLVRNKTAEKEEQLKKDKKNCFRATCDKNTGVTDEEDVCASDYPKCYSSKCVLDGSSYTCKESNLNRPTDTACIKYECSTDKNKGWVVKSKENEESCTKFYEDQHADLRCQNIYCDDNEGCTMSQIKGCSVNCNDTMIQKCIVESLANGNTSYCILPTCQARALGGEMWDVFCNFTSSHENCFEKMENLLQELTKADPDVCYQPICTENGRCSYESITVPDYMVNTECMHAVCVEGSDKSWHWEYHPTEVNDTCITDACTYRECRVGVGCYEENTCTKYNNETECNYYTCEIIADVPTCVNTSLLVETTCTKEVCRDGKKVVVEDYTNCSLAFTYKCLEASCAYDPISVTSECVYSDKPDPSNDPCTIYTCDNETGLFASRPKCDDGLYCTEDLCTVFGDCKYSPVDCSLELPMEGYTCFEARCKENPENETHRCVRKLIRNAYIDVCGNCIQEKDIPENFTSVGSSASSSEEEIDFVECTGAPAKPLLTEGLAAASIALIILAAVIIGAGIAASGVMGTKQLINRAKGANDQSAHTNPLFEDNEAEMSNPAYAGDN